MKSTNEFKILYNHPQLAVSNIARVYDEVTFDDYEEGRNWYESANSFSHSLSNTYNVHVMKVAGIVSALSPMKEWNINKRMAEEFLEKEGQVSSHFRKQIDKAVYILKGPECKKSIENQLKGLKTVNFFNNIFCPADGEYVTVDRHHIQVCTGINTESVTPKQYQFIKKATVDFSKRVNLRPCQLQAILWVTWKRLKSNGKEKKAA